MKTHTGKVFWFNDTKGYGYIAIAPSLKRELGIPDEKDLFVHRHDILRSPRILYAEEKVSFEIRIVPGKGPRAGSVRIADIPAGANQSDPRADRNVGATLEQRADRNVGATLAGKPHHD